jgi:hypothetical protein
MQPAGTDFCKGNTTVYIRSFLYAFWLLHALLLPSHAKRKLKTECVEDLAAYDILDNGVERDIAYICVVAGGFWKDRQLRIEELNCVMLEDLKTKT